MKVRMIAAMTGSGRRVSIGDYHADHNGTMPKWIGGGKAKVIDEAHGAEWSLYHGDSVSVFPQVPDNSVGFTIFSPPFSQLYIYTDSIADMGNCVDDDEFFHHYGFLAPDLYRVTIPGRLCAVHCKDLPLYRGSDGAAGLRDFPGRLIVSMEDAGWTFHSRVTIWKCPVTERERTNNNGLLHKTVTRDSSQIRQGMADYLLLFRKTPAEGDNMSAAPIERVNGLKRWVGDPALDPRKSGYHPSPYARKERDEDRQSIVLLSLIHI